MANVESQSSSGIISQLIDSAGRGFVLIAFGVPVAAALAGVLTRDISFLNLVHVMSGAIWAGATVYVAGIYGPTLVGLEPQIRGQINTPIIPKNVFLFSGVAIAAIITGPVLAVRMGMWNLSDPYILAAVIIVLGLIVMAVYLIWLQVEVFRETGTPGPPDGARVGALGAKIGKASPIMLLLQLAILVDMSLIATGL